MAFRAGIACFLGLALGAAACGSGAAVTGDDQDLTSSDTRVFVIPIDDRVRASCEKEINSYYCNAHVAEDAISSCLARIGAKAPGDVCAAGNAGCMRTQTVSEPCAGTSPVYADETACKTPRFQNCSFYAACLDPKTACGSSGYPIGYGEKYCSRFANQTKFSEAGQLWRDATMLCLQQHLVGFVGASSHSTCDKIRDAAFDSHPACYTQPGHSICFLPPNDIATILQTVSIEDELSSRSQKQMKAVISTCLLQIAGGVFGGPGGVFTKSGDVANLEGNDGAQADRLRFWLEMDRTYGQ